MSIIDSYIHSSCLRPLNTENNIKREITRGVLHLVFYLSKIDILIREDLFKTSNSSVLKVPKFLCYIFFWPSAALVLYANRKLLVLGGYSEKIFHHKIYIYIYISLLLHTHSEDCYRKKNNNELLM